MQENVVEASKQIMDVSMWASFAVFSLSPRRPKEVHA